ncbi:hypothetical protein BS50DRAFT_392628 [Corynespora cassiicola Philippines]|uniref:Uncharacterized protein n=1 Tax=Corynespora cassiicola Philippines TaxID=1448308 RepID=A0A2T2NPV0_CORCC|nr:hypothetical protein BS50DRAFT_392628 [Corynespora cassiicola Philippines]
MFRPPQPPCAQTRYSSGIRRAAAPPHLPLAQPRSHLPQSPNPPLNSAYQRSPPATPATPAHAPPHPPTSGIPSVRPCPIHPRTPLHPSHALLPLTTSKKGRASTCTHARTSVEKRRAGRDRIRLRGILRAAPLLQEKKCVCVDPMARADVAHGIGTWGASHHGCATWQHGTRGRWRGQSLASPSSRSRPHPI